jgi:uncharacterized Zn-binding protein involved in type VI secretion
MSKIAVFSGLDSGGSGICNTPPTSLSPTAPERRVYANGVVVMASGDVLSPASGTTPKGDPCVSQRVVRATRKVFVNGKAIAVRGDSLNIGTGITIATGQSNIFVV